MSTANPEPRHPGEAEGSVRRSSQLDQLRLPLVLTVEEAADRLGVGRTLMYSLVSSGAIESVRISSSPSARPRREPERMLLLGAMAVKKVGHTAKKCRGGAARHPLGVPPKPTLK
jgi:hypothetical protein